MAEGEELQFLTNCKLTINSKFTSGSGKLYKLLTNEMKFKIVKWDPLIIEKDDPSLDDIANVFDGIRSLCKVGESGEQTVIPSVRCDELDVTNSLSLPQTEHTVGDHSQLFTESSTATTKDMIHEKSCEESRSKTSEVSENFNILYREDVTSDMNIPLHGTNNKSQTHTGQSIDAERGEILMKIANGDIWRESEMSDESLLSSYYTLDVEVQETDKQIIEESATDYLSLMSAFKKLDIAETSDTSFAKIESKNEKPMEDIHSSLQDSTSGDSETIENMPAAYSLNKPDTECMNSLSVDNKISDVLQTTASSKDHSSVFGRDGSEDKMMKETGNYETADKLQQNESLLSGKSSLCSGLNWNRTTDIQRMEKIQVDQQSQDIQHDEMNAGCSTKIKLASQQMQHEESEAVYIPEVPDETNMSEELSILSKESRTKEEDFKSFSPPIVSGTYNDNKSDFCFVTETDKLKIKIYKADITKLQVDCIVNAANEHLKHIGGVAKAISDAAGSALRKECNNYTDDSGTLDVTDIFVSTGGNLFAKYVIHAVGPMWDSYDEENKRQCFTDLRRTIIRCLVEANRRGAVSVAFPSVSAAIFRVPKEHCARCYMEAVKHYDILSVGDKLTLQEIHFVDVDDDMVDIIIKCFTSNWYKMSDIDIVLQDAEFVDEYLKSASKDERKDCCSSLTDKEIKCAKEKSTLASVHKEDMGGTGVLIASKPLVDNLTYNQDSSSKLIKEKEKPTLASVHKEDMGGTGVLIASKPLTDNLTYNQDYSSKLRKDKETISRSVAALNDDETYEISTTYQLRKITLQIKSGHAFEIKSDVTFTMGKSFNELSGSPGFSISAGLKLCETVRSQENKYTYFNVSQLEGSQTRFLCEVFPEPEDVDKITEAFENLELAVRICKQLPNALVITSRILYTDSSKVQLQNGVRNKLCMKNVARFAFGLNDFLDKLSKVTQEISVFVVGSEDSLPIIVKVIESNNVVKVKESQDLGKVYPTDYAASAHTDVADTVNTDEVVTVKADGAFTENTGYGTTVNTGDTASIINAGGAASTVITDGAATVLKSAAAIVITDYTDIVSTDGAAAVLKSAAATVSTDYTDIVSTDGTATVVKSAAATVSTDYTTTVLKNSVEGPIRTGTSVLKGATASVSTENECDFCGGNTLCQRVICCEKWLCQDCEQSASACPFCLKLRKIITGNQPPGFMTVDLIDDYADGYEDDGAWEIEYYFPAGIQNECHPHPGEEYDSVCRKAFLPANSHGYQVLVRLRLAFLRNLIFTIGHSNTRNKDDVIVWAGISHKTSLSGKRYGFPDPDYLTRVTLELSNKGIQLSTVTDSEKKQLSEFMARIREFERFSDLE